MSIEQNKAIIRRYIEEIWSSGSLERANEIMAETFRHHTRKSERPLQPLV